MFPAQPGPGGAMPGSVGDQQQPDQGPALFPDLNDAVDYRVPGMSGEKLAALGRRVTKEVQRFKDDTQTRRELVRLWRRDAEMLPADVRQAWPNGAVTRAPITALAVASHSQRLNNQILNADPPFGARARGQNAIDAAPIIEDVLAATLEETDWRSVARDVHKQLSWAGDCLVYTGWERTYAHVPVHYVHADDEAMADLSAAGAAPHEALQGALDTDEDGKALVKLKFQDELTFDGPRLRMVPYADLIAIPATAQDESQLWALGERIRIRGYDLDQGAQDGTYLKDRVAELLRLPGDEERDEDTDEREWIEGVNATYGSVDKAVSYRSYDCVDLDWKDDLNKDGKEEWYILTVHVKSGIVVRCSYSPYEHGRSRYVFFGYLNRERDLWAQSIAEKVASAQDAATGCLCNALDMGDQLNGISGNFYYDVRSGIKPGTFTYAPGRPLYCPISIDGIKPMNEQAASLVSGIEAMLKLYETYKDQADLLAAVSNPSVGKETDTQKTLGEVKLVLGNAMAIFEDNAQGVALCWARVADRVRWMKAQYHDERGMVQYRVAASNELVDDGTGQQVPGTSVWQPGPDGRPMKTQVPGQVGFGNVPAEMLKRDVDLVPAGLNAFPDQQTRLQRSMLVLNTLVENPLTQQMPDVQALALDQVLQDARMPQREKIMQAVKQGIQTQAQMAQMQQIIQMLMQKVASLEGQQPGQPGMNGQNGGPPQNGNGKPPAPQPPQLPMAAAQDLQQSGGGPGLMPQFTAPT